MGPVKEASGPKFIRYFVPVLAVLTELGASATKAEIKDAVAKKLGLTDAEVNEVNEKGTSVFPSKVHWAVWYLSRAGYLSSSQRGVWSLTEKGQTEPIKDEDCLAIFRAVRETLKKPSADSECVDDEAVSPPEGETSLADSHRDALLETLKSLPPAGFERLCQRLLRESGFQQVEVTGKSGDGGIDGIGILQINPILSFRLLFQCKRYSGSVGAGQIRDFRGAMMGRADKGVLITTGTFTADAQKEAMRDGVPPIELVDAEKLIAMFENLQLGLMPRTIFEVDPEFFKEFSK